MLVQRWYDNQFNDGPKGKQKKSDCVILSDSHGENEVVVYFDRGIVTIHKNCGTVSVDIPANRTVVRLD